MASDSEQRNEVFWLPEGPDAEKLTLTADGRWLSNGHEITHEETRRAFFRNLRRDDEHGYHVRIGYEAKRVTVEGTALFVERIDGYDVSLTDGTQSALDPSTLAYREERLTCLVRGQEARFLRVPFNELVRDLEQDSEGYWIRWAGRRWKIA